MISVLGLINVLNSKEKVSFINYLQDRNKRTDTRNIDLFKAFEKKKEEQLKRQLGNNAYNALKKRLTDRLIEFIGAKSLSDELTEESEIIQTLIAARKIIKHQNFELGIKLLLKAEKLAKKVDNYTLLNEVYQSMIEYAHYSVQLNEVELFEKLKKNNEQFMHQQRLSLMFSTMLKSFTKAEFNTSSLKEIYQTSIQKYQLNEDMLYNFQNLNQLCVIADVYAAQTHNYHGVDLFFESKIKDLQGSILDNENALSFHVELLFGLANIYFRKQEFVKSLDYLKNMYEQLLRFNQKFYPQWELKYGVLFSLNLNFIGEQELALKKLKKLQEVQHIKESELGLVNMSLVLIYFQKGNLKEVKNVLHTFTRTDAWYLKNLGREWLFNLKAMEILLHFDLGNDLLVESRINSFQRKYGKQYQKESSNPIWPFLRLIKQLLQNPNLAENSEFSQQIELAIPWKKTKEEDLFFICYYAWLKAKLTPEKDVYATTLEILGN